MDLSILWNAVYAGGKMPWDSEYSGGELLETEALAKNFEQVDAEVNWTSSVPRNVVMNTLFILTDKVIPKFK